MRSARSPFLPILAIGCGLLSAGLIYWSRTQQAPMPLPIPISAEGEPVDAPPAPEAAQPAATPPSEIPKTEGSPEVLLSAPSAPESPIPPQAPGSLSTRPTEEELTGPLPTGGADDKIPPAPALHAPITEVVRAPSGTHLAAPAPAGSLDFAALAANPKRWPPQVLLRAAVGFPIFRNGLEVGVVKVPAATPVLLRKVHSNGQVEIEHLNALATVPAAKTDLDARIKPGMGIAGFAAAATPKAAAASATPSPSATPPSATPALPLGVTITRSRHTEPGADGVPRQTWRFHIRVQNPTSKAYPGMQGRFFALSRAENGPLILAAGEKLGCDLEPNAEITLSTAPVPLDARNPLDSFAVQFRDSQGTLLGAAASRESLTRDWGALEVAQVGGPIGSQPPARTPAARE